MWDWLRDAANAAEIVQAIAALGALVIAIIGLRAARQVWPAIRRRYSDSVHTEHQSGTQVIGDGNTVNVMQTVQTRGVSEQEASIEG